MEYRKYGRSNELVSAVGLGGHREGMETGEGLTRSARFFATAQARAAVVGAAIDAGVTYFDTTFGCEMQSLGESLRLLGRREGLFVSGMRVDFFGLWPQSGLAPGAYLRREVEGRLTDGDLDHLDQFMLGAMEQGDPLAHRGEMDEVLAESQRLKAEGKIRYLGFSCHNHDYAAKLLRAWPFDSVMSAYNPANRAAEGELLAAVSETGAAFVAMKTLVWRLYGVPATVLRHLNLGRFGLDANTPIGTLAHRWVLDQALLTTCVPAANSLEAVAENTAAADRGPLTGEERALVDRWVAATAADHSLPLALGGLCESNLRVRSCALALAADRLGVARPHLDLSVADAERQAQEAAEQVLAEAARRPQWCDLLG